MDQTLRPGLYIVATPIGNLGDITLRAIEVLRGVSVIACEDSRITGKLLNHLQISKRMIRYDDHASERDRNALIERMHSEAVALVSDAGTPLVSDPGFRLVKAAREAGVEITSLPGPAAAIVALTLSGLPSDRFLFAGFLPNKAKARGDALIDLADVPATLVFYETAPRIVDALRAVAQFLPGREVAVARELTKKFEECRSGDPLDIAGHYESHPAKGEIVLMVGPPVAKTLSEADVDALLRNELASLKPSQAAAKVARETGIDRKVLYTKALSLK
ncbi:MAG: 16S rRNA (cytidine(1402)-2'-O)-methyltransferase [Sphingomonadaceae bacterium]|nr:16S rRNA (cytidine(1402)-2'-O)-methyltransferase [Sphingomonadaceae bacterium]